MGDSQQDQPRQRAREAMNRVLDIQGDRGGGEWFAHVDSPWIIARVIGDAIEVYFDERMRGEPSEYQRGASDQETALRTVIHDALDRVGAPSRDESGAHLGEGNRIAAFGREMMAAHARITELETALDQAVNGNAALWRRIFELEAVVRAADAMREDLLERRRRDEDARTPDREGHALDAYDAARTKLVVPHG